MYIAVDMKKRTYDMGMRQQAKDSTRDAIVRATIHINGQLFIRTATVKVA